MDAAFNALFDGDVNTEVLLRAQILLIPARTMRGFARQYLDIINSRVLDAALRAQLKQDLRAIEDAWGVRVFLWDPTDVQFHVEIDHMALEDRVSRYFQVIEALDRAWTGDVHFNIWARIRATSSISDVQ